MEYPFTSYRFGGDLKTICMLKTPFLYYQAFQADSCIPHFKGTNRNITSGHFRDEIHRESLLMGFRQISSYLPEQVPANKFLFAGTVPANKFLFAGTVPANKF